MGPKLVTRRRYPGPRPTLTRSSMLRMWNTADNKVGGQARCGPERRHRYRKAAGQGEKGEWERCRSSVLQRIGRAGVSGILSCGTHGGGNKKSDSGNNSHVILHEFAPVIGFPLWLR